MNTLIRERSRSFVELMVAPKLSVNVENFQSIKRTLIRTLLFRHHFRCHRGILVDLLEVETLPSRIIWESSQKTIRISDILLSSIEPSVEVVVRLLLLLLLKTTNRDNIKDKDNENSLKKRKSQIVSVIATTFSLMRLFRRIHFKIQVEN